MTSDATIQLVVFFCLNAAVALITWLHCRKATRSTESTKEFFLANSGLSWVFIAGSITLTNINTDTLVGMNGGQMLLLSLWEISAVAGLFLLAKIFVPIYYRYNCTTVTELLERRYNNKHIRATVAVIFKEREEGKIQLSIRSRPGYDVSSVALALGFARPRRRSRARAVAGQHYDL